MIGDNSPDGELLKRKCRRNRREGTTNGTLFCMVKKEDDVLANGHVVCEMGLTQMNLGR